MLIAPLHYSDYNYLTRTCFAEHLTVEASWNLSEKLSKEAPPVDIATWTFVIFVSESVDVPEIIGRLETLAALGFRSTTVGAFWS